MNSINECRGFVCLCIQPATPTPRGYGARTRTLSSPPSQTLEISHFPESRPSDDFHEDRERLGDLSRQQIRGEHHTVSAHVEPESTSNYIEDDEDESLQTRGQRNNEELLEHLRSREPEEEDLEVGESQILQVFPRPPDVSTGQGRYDMRIDKSGGHDLVSCHPGNLRCLLMVTE